VHWGEGRLTGGALDQMGQVTGWAFDRGQVTGALDREGAHELPSFRPTVAN